MKTFDKLQLSFATGYQVLVVTVTT